MNKPLKKIIAREGLIIAGIIVSGLIVIVLSGRLRGYFYEKISYSEIKWVDYYPEPEGDSFERLKNLRIYDPQFNNLDDEAFINKLIEIKPHLKEIFNKIKKDIVDFKTKNKPVKKAIYEQKRDEQSAKLFDVFTSIENYSFIYLFFAYPIYLLVRFIIWAVKALKSNH